MKKENTFLIYTLIILGLVLILTSHCKKEEEKRVPIIATITTAITTSITTNTVTSGGNVTGDGGATITERGVCYSTTQSPTAASSKVTAAGTTGAFTTSIADLTPETTYYIKAYATNSVGTAYGNEVNFTTYNVGAISDVDNNYYNIVTIGIQTWMKENLKTTKYRDGSAIPNITNNTWTTQTSGAYCWYNNDTTTYKTAYGALYNWYAVVDNRNLCPTGWHVPTDTEWNILTDYLGGESVAGGKLKATTLWDSPNTGTDNSSDFTALPGGYRNNGDGNSRFIGVYGYWWSSTEFNSTNAWFRMLNYTGPGIDRINSPKRNGFSVRCLKDS